MTTWPTASSRDQRNQTNNNYTLPTDKIKAVSAIVKYRSDCFFSCQGDKESNQVNKGSSSKGSNFKQDKTQKMEAESPPIIAKIRAKEPSPGTETSKKDKGQNPQEQVNLETLNIISEEYINNQEKWHNLEAVELRILELNRQLQLTDDDNLRRRINTILSTYKIQNKYLLQIEADKLRKQHKATNKGTDTNPIEIDNEDRSLMSGIVHDINNKEQPNDQNKRNSPNNKRKRHEAKPTSPTRRAKVDNPYK